MEKSRPFDQDIPNVEDGIFWRIEKRGYRITVWCNGKQLLDFTTSSEKCTDLSFTDSWGRNAVKMSFDRSKNNKEETFYFLGKGSHIFSSFSEFSVDLFILKNEYIVTKQISSRAFYHFRKHMGGLCDRPTQSSSFLSDSCFSLLFFISQFDNHSNWT